MELVQQNHKFLLNMTVEEALALQIELAKSISHAHKFVVSHHVAPIILLKDQDQPIGTSITFSINRD